MIYSASDTDGWISGIAFTKNLWNHAKNSAIAYAQALNGGSKIDWDSVWHNDQLARIPLGKVSELKIPVVPSGKDKIVYLNEHNNDWLGTMHGSVTINGRIAERFMTSYVNNPFAAHMNSKIYSRYMATRIPAEWISPNDNFITLRIDMTNMNHYIYLREAGTHDYM